ncbi:uncharacterized protein LOC129586620 [Paramacrobiotus metropolitanus]|uniref:uncharacterized protein LOC129586620 n=1 Tax=Paramacrobiotus metropolitanus TaxID=2943436 RepID=UPI00244620A2|nr:uncharacterized protein LOC129586620 [Paramacrobiotus metropolitanus]
MILTFLFYFAALGIVANSAQQCSPSLPTTLQGVGGDTPKQADGVWYVYRKMGGNYSTAAQIQITSVAPYPDPVTSQPGYLQWWQIVSDTAGAPCQHQFWTGSYTNGGMQIGDLGGSDDNYIMRPTDFVVLYHDYQNLMVTYGCSKSQADNVHCATATIIAQTRKRPDQLSASEMDNFDSIINSVFSKYCVTVQTIPKDVYGPKGTCTAIDPPFCVAQDIQGMKNTIINATSPPATTSSPNYGSNTPTTTGCKWPNAFPSQGVVNNKLMDGRFYIWRRMFAPEASPVNQQVDFHDVGASASPLINATARTIWAEYANYASANSSQCVNGLFVGQIQDTGLLTGLVIPYTADGAPQPLTAMFLYADTTQLLFYGCGAQNLQTGICDAPVVAHCTKANPLQMTQTEKDALDALEDRFLSQYGCSAAKDVPLIFHTSDKPLCPMTPPTDCMQNHITGYQQVLASMNAGSGYSY